LLRLSTSTAVTTSCGIPIVQPLSLGVNDVPRQV
jgi:hypothetical protein